MQPMMVGYKSKKDAMENKKQLFYNFVPHDKKDPVLLALFTTD